MQYLQLIYTLIKDETPSGPARYNTGDQNTRDARLGGSETMT